MPRASRPSFLRGRSRSSSMCGKRHPGCGTLCALRLIVGGVGADSSLPDRPRGLPGRMARGSTRARWGGCPRAGNKLHRRSHRCRHRAHGRGSTQLNVDALDHAPLCSQRLPGSAPVDHCRRYARGASVNGRGVGVRGRPQQGLGRRGPGAWNPRLRSKTAVRTSLTRHFCDPPLAAALLRRPPPARCSRTSTRWAFCLNRCVSAAYGSTWTTWGLRLPLPGQGRARGGRRADTAGWPMSPS